LLRDHDRNRKRVVAASGSSAAAGGNDSQDAHYRLDLSWNNRQLAAAANNSSEEAATATSKPTQEQQQSISLPVQFINDSQQEKERIQTLIVATKAHQAKEAVESVLDRLLPPAMTDDMEPANGDENSASSSTQIIVLCNGALSVRDELSKLLSQTSSNTDSNPVSLALATTTHGAYLSEPSKLVHAGVGTTFLEEKEEQRPMDGMVDLWNRAGLNCTSLSSQQMNSMLWNKLAANCVINPLTSLFQCTNGELLEEPAFPIWKEDILNEVAAVATGVAGLEGAKNPNDASNGIPTVEEMRDFVDQTIRDTHNNKSSMYQDIIAGMSEQTEIEHLNGYVVRKGNEMGKDCRVNEELCSRISELSYRASLHR
jgi:2-dehydropantoate 2-reductase